MLKHLRFDRKRRGLWLILLGVGLLAYAAIRLYLVAPVAQYMIPSPIEGQAQAQGEGDPEGGNAAPQEGLLAGLMEAFEDRKGELGEGAQAGMAATVYDYAFSSSAAQSDASTLTCADAGFFEAHPKYLLSGRLASAEEHKTGAKVIVLDEQLAFKLFPTTEPIEGKVQIDSVWYTVIGVVRHDRQPGDSDAYGAYIPLQTAAVAKMQTDFVQIDCRLTLPGASRALESVAMASLGEDGDFCDTSKEVMRATMIVRVLAVIFAMYLIFALLRAWNGRTRALIAGWQEEVMHRYFKKMLPGVIGLSALQLLGYALLAGAAAGVLALMIRPMYVFTEWIPEVVVEWSKIEARLQGLLTAAADPMTLKTREFASIRFYGALVRWGVVCLMSGLLLFRRRIKKA